MSFLAHPSAASGGPAQLTVAETWPFTVEVQRRKLVTIVRPRGELDLATAETLRSTLDAAIAETMSAGLDGVHLVVDLRSLSFIDSAGLHLLGALDQRAQCDGFQLTLLAPPAPIDRAIQLCGLDQILPFADRGSEVLSDVS